MTEAEMTETADYEKSADPTAHASSHESAGADAIDNLGPLTGLIISGNGVITWQGASVAESYLFETKVSGDTNPRLRIRADGFIIWGPGNAAPDTSFYRGWANDITFNCNANFTWTTIWFSSHNTTFISLRTSCTGESFDRFQILRGGQLQWSSGAAAIDCIISRRAANILNTPDRFEVGTLGVANSVAGTTPGSCQNKAEIFDAAGNSLGFIAIYDAIT